MNSRLLVRRGTFQIELLRPDHVPSRPPRLMVTKYEGDGDSVDWKQEISFDEFEDLRNAIESMPPVRR